MRCESHFSITGMSYNLAFRLFVLSFKPTKQIVSLDFYGHWTSRSAAVVAFEPGLPETGATICSDLMEFCNLVHHKNSFSESLIGFLLDSFSYIQMGVVSWEGTPEMVLVWFPLKPTPKRVP